MTLTGLSFPCSHSLLFVVTLLDFFFCSCEKSLVEAGWVLCSDGSEVFTPSNLSWEQAPALQASCQGSYLLCSRALFWYMAVASLLKHVAFSGNHEGGTQLLGSWDLSHKELWQLRWALGSWFAICRGTNGERSDLGLHVVRNLWCLTTGVLHFELIWKSVGLVILSTTLPCSCQAWQQALAHIRVCCSLLVNFYERKIWTSLSGPVSCYSCALSRLIANLNSGQHLELNMFYCSQRACLGLYLSVSFVCS